MEDKGVREIMLLILSCDGEHVKSCPWVGLTHGFGWVGLGRDFSVFGELGSVHYSKSTKNLKGLW